jgi:hypothetical protein
MIAFGVSITEPEPYRRYAEPGIRAAAEPDSEVHAFAAVGPISRTYNLLLDVAGRRDDLEALVLVHTHTEIADPGFAAKVRAELADPRVAIVGAAGATGVRSIAWWEGAITPSATLHAYEEHGGGELPAYSWAQTRAPAGEVDAVDGSLLILSPWAVRNLRFDEALIGHGFDLDVCLQARAAGHTVVATDLRVIQHRALDMIGDPEIWVESHQRVARKWLGRMPDGEPETVDWKARARRAEAEREAARAVTYSKALGSDARVLTLERELEAATSTLSWRVTSPLRRINHLRRQLGRR